jgi:ABC-2 type transport system permease protein
MPQAAFPAMKTALAFIKRDFLIASSYKAAFAADVLGIVFKVITFYYVGAVFGGAPLLAAFGNNYFAFLIIGVALMDFVHTSLENFAVNIRDSQLTGTLELVLLSPIRVPDMVVYSSLWAYIFTAARFATYMTVGVVLFGLRLSPHGILPALVVLLLTILCFAPLGIISAAIIMVFKKGAWFQMMVNGAGFLLGGVAYPVDVLPAWASRISEYLPLTHSVRGMRETLLGGSGLGGIQDDLIFMTAFAAVMMPIALWIFELSVNRTKQLGTLTQY